MQKINKKAFTLIELLIVIAIIGILFIVLVSKVDFATDKAKATGVQTDFRSFQLAFDQVAKENAGFNSLGWDTGDDNGDRIRNSYDKGDNGDGGGIAQNGIQDGTEVFVGSKTYGETWNEVFTLVNPNNSKDASAFVALENAINSNLDPKLHITITPEANGSGELTGTAVITMANQARDPWKNEYHGVYISHAERDGGADRGAIIIYSNGANGKWGSEHDITNGVVSVTVPGNNTYGKDDYSIVSCYTFVNGYGEVLNMSTGFSNNQSFMAGTNNSSPIVPGGNGGNGGGSGNNGNLGNDDNVPDTMEFNKDYTFATYIPDDVLRSVILKGQLINDSDGLQTYQLAYENYGDNSGTLFGLIGNLYGTDVLALLGEIEGDSYVDSFMYITPSVRDLYTSMGVSVSEGWNYMEDGLDGNFTFVDYPLVVSFSENVELSVSSLSDLAPLFGTYTNTSHTHNYVIKLASSSTLAGETACGKKYYYSCACGQNDTRTFSVGEHVRSGSRCTVCGESLAGLYDTSSNYETLLMSWDDLINNGVISVVDGVVYKGVTPVSNLPAMNEYGFYFGVPYTYGDTATITFFADNSMRISFDGQAADIPAIDGIYSYGIVDLSSLELGIYTIKQNGTILFDELSNICFQLGSRGQSLTTYGDLLFPDNIVKIAQSTFEDNKYLTGVTFSEGLKVIDMYAFDGCSGLKHIELPDSLEEILNMAFQYCTGLTELTIPKGIRNMGAHAFSECTNVRTLTIEEGVTFLAGFEHLAITSVYIPSSVQSFGHQTFLSCEELTTVTFAPNSQLIDLGSRSFAYCRKLKSINLPTTITVIPQDTFNGCAFTEFTLHEGIEEIGRSAFNDCKLQSITLPSTLKIIDSYAFCNLRNMTSIRIPASVTSIAANAFSSSTINTIYFAGTEAQWNAISKQASDFSGKTIIYNS